MTTKIVLSNEDAEKMNALCKQYNKNYNAQYREFQEKMKPITKKFEEDVEKEFAA